MTTSTSRERRTVKADYLAQAPPARAADRRRRLVEGAEVLS